MLSDEFVERLSERLVQRYQKLNETILEKIGETVKEIGSLTPTDAMRLETILKYGGDYDKITQELAKITGLSVQDIQDIYKEVSERDLEFAEQFYNYRGVSYIPYDENLALQRQTEAFSRIMVNDVINQTNMLGYGLQDDDGNIVYSGIKDIYNQLIDEAISSISMGKETFQESMYRQLKALGSGGLRVIYPSTYIDKNGVEKHRTMRLDSVLRTNLQEGIRKLHNANQELIGEDFGYNGIEVTHHSNAAPDHIDTVDGKQFILIDRVQEQINAGIETEIKPEDIKGDRVKVKGKWYEDFNAVNDSLDRKVSTLNCKHTTYSIIVGISKPEYTNEQLERDKERNLKGFEYEGKHYTNYEGTQLQRRIETEIRKLKDTQILAKASGNEELLYRSQDNIRILTNKYKKLSDVSGLPTKMQRMRVSQYRRKAGDTRSYYEKNLLGKTYGDITINSVSKHLLDRKTSRQLWLDDIENGLSNPLKITDVKFDVEGRPSLQYIGERATIVLNPKTGNIVSVWKTGSKRVKKLRGDK